MVLFGLLPERSIISNLVTIFGEVQVALHMI